MSLRFLKLALVAAAYVLPAGAFLLHCPITLATQRPLTRLSIAQGAFAVLSCLFLTPFIQLASTGDSVLTEHTLLLSFRQ
jgi:hypothetical protein